MILTALITVIGAYLIGSINFAVIITKLLAKRDVRDFGSGNAGTTNVARVLGPVPAAVTFLLDIAKGVVSSVMGKLIFDYISKSSGDAWAVPIYGAYICGIACMLGHVFPVFFQFKGGKGVATGVGVYLVCSTQSILIALAVFAVLFLITRIVSFSSIISTFVCVILSLVFYTKGAPFLPQMFLSLILGIIIVSKHKDNIKRLLAGEEKRLTFGGKKNG